MCGLLQFALRKWTQSIYKHKIHHTYCLNFEVYWQFNVITKAWSQGGGFGTWAGGKPIEFLRAKIGGFRHTCFVHTFILYPYKNQIHCPTLYIIYTFIRSWKCLNIIFMVNRQFCNVRALKLLFYYEEWTRKHLKIVPDAAMPLHQFINHHIPLNGNLL